MGSIVVTLVFLLLIVGCLAAAGYVAYGKWKEVEKTNRQHDVDLKQQREEAKNHERLLQEYNKRLLETNSNLSEQDRRTLLNIQEREKIAQRVEENAQRVEENAERIKNQAISARLKDEADAVRIRTQSVRLQNSREETENKDEKEDDADAVRIGNAPSNLATGERETDAEEGEDDEEKGTNGEKGRRTEAEAALHVTDGKVTKYVPLLAGMLWSADGSVKLGGGNARVQSSKTDSRKVEVHDSLFSPHMSTNRIDVSGKDGVAVFPGADSEHNPGHWKTYFGRMGPKGVNYIRGDTEILGDVETRGKLNARGGIHSDDLLCKKSARFRPARTRSQTSGKKEEGEGEGTAASESKHTAFPGGARGEHNIISGDTRVHGDFDLRAGDLSNSGTGIVRASNGAINKNNHMSMEPGLQDSPSSALNFNGMSSTHTWTEKGFDTDKSRWRLVTDQAGDNDVFQIDQALHPRHPDADPPPKGDDKFFPKTWVPLSIDKNTGRITLRGEVQVCDKDGKQCRVL